MPKATVLRDHPALRHIAALGRRAPRGAARQHVNKGNRSYRRAPSAAAPARPGTPLWGALVLQDNPEKLRKNV